MADTRFVKKGGWDSIHIVEVVPSADNKSATYKLTTTVMLNMSVDNEEVGDTNLSGSVTRQVRGWGSNVASDMTLREPGDSFVHSCDLYTNVSPYTYI